MDVVADALAHCLATEGKSRPVFVPGLGTFHVRKRGADAKEPGWGVLFLLDGAFREAVGRDEVSAETEGLRFDEWLATQSGRTFSLKEFTAHIREAVSGGREIAIDSLGTFRPRTSKAKIRNAAGDVTKLPSGWVVAFQPSDSLKKRLQRESD